MKILVKHNNHIICFERALTYADLIIDSEIVEIKNSFTGIHFQSFELNGQISNTDGTVDDVKAVLKLGFIKDSISIYYNGALIKSEKVAL